MASAHTCAKGGNPAFTADQLAPAVVLFRIPPPSVPAYTIIGVAGSIASANTTPFVIAPVAVRLAPPVVLLNTPSPAVPAYTMLAFVGSTASACVVAQFGP